jgi:hypothetical protein
VAKVTAAKAASNRKWDQQNMKKLQVNLRVDVAESVKLYAEDRNLSVHGIIKDHLESLLQADAQEKGHSSMDQYIYDMSTEYRTRHPND